MNTARDPDEFFGSLVRSVHHRSSAHGKGMYWNLTGHAPPQAEVAVNQPPSRQDWPSLGAMVGKIRQAQRGMPNSIQLPYPFVDNNSSRRVRAPVGSAQRSTR